MRRTKAELRPKSDASEVQRVASKWEMRRFREALAAAGRIASPVECLAGVGACRLRPSESLVWCVHVATQQSNLPRDSASAGKGGGNSRLSNTADLELMQRMRSGDEDAFTVFYDRFAPGLFSMIHEILHDQKEAEDVLQESFVQMWKRTATYDASRSSLFTWAVMISRHKAIDHLRSRQRQSRLKEEVAAETSASDSAAPTGEDDHARLWSDERKRLQAALAKLGDSQREAINLAFFGGLTQTQISQRLGTPLGTVKARIRRGLLALRESLGEAFL